MTSKISDERLAEILGSDMAVGTSEQVGALIWELAREVSEYRALEAATVTGETSDGYHTFNELYEYRMLYNAHAAHGWLAEQSVSAVFREHWNDEQEQGHCTIAPDIAAALGITTGDEDE